MRGMYDVHCHILPQVDDGAESMETALEMLQREKEDGVENIIVTPHYRRGMFQTSLEKIESAFMLLKENTADWGIHLYLGCEYHVNMDMIQDLRRGFRPTLSGSDYVLCEFQEAVQEQFIKERTYQLVGHGYVPVLAHIERYEVIRKNFGLIEELGDMGCRMQVNAGSILGKDGFKIKRFCAKLMKYDLIDFIGSDAHDLAERAPLLGECAEYLQKKMGNEYAKKILCENPGRITGC